jgi:hypothetical protein
MCDIYHHPSSPPPKLQDRPQLPAEFQPTDEERYVSTRSGELAADPSPQHAAERWETPEELELLAVTDGLTALIQKHGAPRIMRLVRMLAHLAGQEV